MDMIVHFAPRQVPDVGSRSARLSTKNPWPKLLCFAGQSTACVVYSAGRLRKAQGCKHRMLVIPNVGSLVIRP